MEKSISKKQDGREVSYGDVIKALQEIDNYKLSRKIKVSGNIENTPYSFSIFDIHHLIEHLISEFAPEDKGNDYCKGKIKTFEEKNQRRIYITLKYGHVINITSGYSSILCKPSRRVTLDVLVSKDSEEEISGGALA